MATDWPEAELQDISTLTKYAFSKTADTYFCTTCGSHMFWKSQQATEITTGTLKDSTERVNFQYHCWVADTKDSGFSDWLPTMNGQHMRKRREGDEHVEELPRWWTESTGRQAEARLPVYCACKGIELYISRPSVISGIGQDTPTTQRYDASNCACNSCRLATGADIAQWASIPRNNIKLANGEAFNFEFGTLKSYSGTKDAKRYFCGRCGASAFYTTTAKPDMVDVAVGLLDASSGARAEDWLDWDSDKVDFEVDAPNRGLVTALADGLKLWREHKEHIGKA